MGDGLLVVRCRGFAVENVVGRVVNEHRACPFGFLGENAGSPGIDRVSLAWLAFRAIDRGIGGGVDDQPRSRAAYRGDHRVRVSQIERGVVQRNDLAARRQHARELETQLSLRPDKQDPRSRHGYASASENGVPAASLAASVGACCRGHAMPSVESFHSRLRSNSAYQ